jgi:cation/acetate symporter
MIAAYGYDGFLYSIGYLAGWIVALFVIAEPMKRLGKFTFADALDSTFDSRGIKLVAGISTLVVSIFYLIPQMVGAGALIQPLLGLPHWVGVVLVGAVVIVIVVTAGMVSTTWVQFLKGSMLVIFSFILTAMVLSRGLEVRGGGSDGHVFTTIGPIAETEFAAATELDRKNVAAR